MFEEGAGRRRLSAAVIVWALVVAGACLAAVAAPAHAQDLGSRSVRHLAASDGTTTADRDDRSLAARDPDRRNRDKDTGLFSGLPLGGFLTTLGVAVLIGATAGRVHVGLIGEED